ncbi:MAG TPA: hypothetical protein VGI46_05530 [Candidatus Acidoferrum sp.]|jgi:hypothetical protein
MTETLQAIVWAGSACAILDGFAASIQLGLMGIKPVRVWQGVASGLLGERAFREGWLSGSLGLLLHFAIAFTAATVFVAASGRIPFLARDYWISGPLYGVAVFFVMNLIVVPLSARPKRQVSSQAVVVQFIIHILFVGLPIALATNRFFS